MRRASSLAPSASSTNVLVEEAGLLQELATLGADDRRMADAWRLVTEASTPAERTLSATAYLDIVSIEAYKVAAPGSSTWHAAEGRLARMQTARARLATSYAAYLEAANSSVGQMAFAAERHKLPGLLAPQPGLRPRLDD